jgi:hypothetical protein
MARPETLVPGNCYFHVGYYDKDLRLPMIETFVYVREVVHPDTGGRAWLFKEPDGDVPDGEEPQPGDYQLVDDTQLHSMLDFDGLARRLREIASLHPLHQLPVVAVEPPSEQEFATIPGAVDRALNDPECLSVTLTIRYGGRGLSVGREPAGWQMSLGTSPRLDPDDDARVLAFFAGLGLPPVSNYLANAGRTRLLAFSLPSERAAVVALCRRVFVEVYDIRKGDVIDCHVLTRADMPAGWRGSSDIG